jgi:hypothetical protein
MGSLQAAAQRSLLTAMVFLLRCSFILATAKRPCTCHKQQNWGLMMTIPFHIADAALGSQLTCVSAFA